MPNKRTGQDYLNLKPVRIDSPNKPKMIEVDGGSAGGGRTTKNRAEQIRNATPQMRGKNIKNAVLKGKPGKIKPIGTAKGKAKITKLKKKKK